MGEKGNEELCAASSKIFIEYARRFAHGHGRFLDPDQKINGMELIHSSRMENGIVSLRT